MHDSLTIGDPRYAQLFDLQKDAAEHNEINGDLTPSMNALREKAPLLQGFLRDLLRQPNTNHYTVEQETYQLFTFGRAQE